jgi:hypothetical protein
VGRKAAGPHEEKKDRGDAINRRGNNERERERIKATPRCKGQKNRLGGGWKLAGQLRAEAEKWNGRLWRKDREMT